MNKSSSEKCTLAYEIYSNEIFVLLIQHTFQQGRQLTIYKYMREFEQNQDFTIFLVNSISSINELFFMLTFKEQAEYPLFNHILRDQAGQQVNLIHLMEIQKSNKLWLCYQFVSFTQVDLMLIFEKIQNVHQIINSNWLQLEKINQSEDSEKLIQEISNLLSQINQALK